MGDRRRRSPQGRRWYAVGIRRPDPNGIFLVRQIAVWAWSVRNAEYIAVLDNPGCRATLMLACPAEGYASREEAERLITHQDWTAWP